MIEKLRRIALTVALVSGASGTTADTTASIDPFVGSFVATSVTDPTGTLTLRDLNVSVRQNRRGFVIRWISAVLESGRTERFEHEVYFERTRHANVFRAHRSPSITGNARAPDPVDGRPYFWSRISGNALIVYVMAIHGDGTVDLRIYRRTLSADGMALDFTRIVDDRTVTRVHGMLGRTEG